MSSQLRQIQRQSPQHSHRLWYNCPDADLYLWKAAGDIERFEFCYDKGVHEKSIRWQHQSGCNKMCVDDGEDNARHGKRSAILQACGAPNWQAAARHFRLHSQQLPLAIRHFILVHITNELMTSRPLSSKIRP